MDKTHEYNSCDYTGVDWTEWKNLSLPFQQAHPRFQEFMFSIIFISDVVKHANLNIFNIRWSIAAL